MRIRLILIAGLLLAAGEGAAQCTDETARQTPGSWSRGEDNLANDRALPPFVRENAMRKADQVLGLVQRAIPQPKGVQAKAYRSRGVASVDGGPLRYGVTAYFLGYFCVPQSVGNADLRGKILLGDETATWIYIKFNDLSQLVTPLGEQFKTTDGDAILSFPHRTVDFKGHAHYAWSTSHGEQWEAILVKGRDMRLTRDVSRGEFLIVRENIERDETAQLRKTAEARPGAKAGIEKSVKLYEQRLAKLAALREGMSAAEREQPAVVRNTHTGNRDHITFAATGERGERLVVLNPDFFDARLPRYAIQFAVVLVRWQPNQPAKVEAMRQFRENFDLEALRALLGAS